jgi:hypothetical protein
VRGSRTALDDTVQLVLARLVLVALAVVSGAVAIHALHADHRCGEVKADAARKPLRTSPAALVAAADRCGDPRDRVIIATFLVARGRRSDAAELARRMTKATPGDYLGWLAVWNLTRDPGALRRAHALNPRGTPAPR